MVLKAVSNSGGGGGGGATIPDTTNLISGSGTGNGADSGIAPANVVTSASNITDTAIVRGSGGVKGVQTTGILVDSSNNITAAGTISSAAVTITSGSAGALIVGANGATNAALQVDSSTASSATGLLIKSAAAGAGVTLSAISSATNETFNISSKGSGNFNLTGGGNVAIAFGNFQNIRVTSGGGTVWVCTGLTQVWGLTNSSPNAADTRYAFGGSNDSSAGLTASTEAVDFLVDMSQTRQHATGAITTQRDIRFIGSTHTFVGASTITTAAAFSVDGASIAGTNATITNSCAIYSAGVAVGSGVTNSYAANLTANTGATNNYIVSFNGLAGEVINVRTDGRIKILATNAGSSGAQTINQPAGRVQFAVAAGSVVVTNSLCTAASLVFAQVAGTDATMKSVVAVSGAGSFTLTANAASTSAVLVNFWIIN